MATLKRGANVALTREVPNLRRVVLGVSWDAGAERALDQNLVMATMLCDSSSRVLSSAHFVFFNQLLSPDLSVAQLANALGNDKEQLVIDLPSVPPEVERIVVTLYVNAGPGQRRTLARLRSCAIRVINDTDQVELVRSEDLAPGLSHETAVTLGEMYRHLEGWKFKVLGQGYADGIQALAVDYGLPV